MKSTLKSIVLWIGYILGYGVLFYVISSVFDLILGSDEPVTWKSHLLESVFFGIFFAVVNNWQEKKSAKKKEVAKME